MEQNYKPKFDLTLKKGFLTFFIMYLCNFIAGLSFSYFIKWSYGSDQVDFNLIGFIPALIGAILVLVYILNDYRRFGKSLLSQVGLNDYKLNQHKSIQLVIVMFVGSHLFAWFYRSVFLPFFNMEGIVGGASKIFVHIKESGSATGMFFFLFLALVVGPIMEEFVFRGYLQSALYKKLSIGAANIIVSLLFMLGHNPIALWPIYFVFSIAWGYVFIRTGSLKMAILIHILNNLFYTVIAAMELNILA